MMNKYSIISKLLQNYNNLFLETEFIAIKKIDSGISKFRQKCLSIVSIARTSMKSSLDEETGIKF